MPIASCDRCGQIREVDEYERGIWICLPCVPTTDPESTAAYNKWRDSLKEKSDTAAEDLAERLIAAVRDYIKPDCVSFGAFIERASKEYHRFEKETKNG